MTHVYSTAMQGNHKAANADLSAPPCPRHCSGPLAPSPPDAETLLAAAAHRWPCPPVLPAGLLGGCSGVQYAVIGHEHHRSIKLPLIPFAACNYTVFTQYSLPVPAPALPQLPDGLQQLSLYSNALSGPIPKRLKLPSALLNLDLSANDLSGPFPAGSFSGALKLPDGLEELWCVPVSHVALLRAGLWCLLALQASPIRPCRGPVVYRLGYVSWVARPWCAGAHWAPSPLTLSKKKLEHWRLTRLLFTAMLALRCRLDNNRLTGNLTGGSWLPANLQLLSLHHNKMNGKLPQDLELPSTLRQISLHFNQFTGGCFLLWSGGRGCQGVKKPATGCSTLKVWE
jgi:hypothetical protein